MFVDLSGSRFGRLVVLREGYRKWRKIFWKCKCDCGKISYTTTQKLKSGHTKSCGCLSAEMARDRAKKAKKHGHTCGFRQSRTYASWRSIMGRCYNKNHKDYPKYGNCGIKVCKRWHTFVNFLSDMGDRPENTTIDRICGTKGYYAKNCRWASPSVQGRNTKTCKLTAHMVKKIRKDKRVQRIIAKDYGISQSCVSSIKNKRTWADVC